MLDYLASKSAYREHEERIRSLTQVEDADALLTREAGHWQAPSVAIVLSSLSKGLASVGERLTAKHEAAQDNAPEVSEGNRLAGSLRVTR